MFDLTWGFAMLAALAVGAFALGRWFGRVGPLPFAQGLGVAAVVAQAVWVAFLADNIRLAAVLPVSNLIVVGNWTPLLTSFLGGLAWSILPRQASPETVDPASEGRAGRGGRALLVRRLVVALALQGTGWTAAVRPVWGTPPACRDRWEGDFCWQTTPFTCSAACAATLLKAHGIAATEGEMARLCLTRRGTLWQGMYRGLKRKTAGTSWDVEIVRGSFDRLLTVGGPAILAAGIPRDAQVARIYTERYGWTPGEWHSVLFFGPRVPGRVAMGDPTPGIGREEWTEEDLRTLWDGVGMRLVRRDR